MEIVRRFSMIKRPEGEINMDDLIELIGIDKTYGDKGRSYRALKSVDLSVERGELIAIVGPSGCGKSTLLNMITGIDRPSRGSVRVAGVRISSMNEDRLARWRRKSVGIVFQFFQLFPTLTTFENVILPMDLLRELNRKERRKRARKILKMVGLEEKAENLPSELSGGEQQRVAIARALSNDPEIIVADEPTGNLDSKTERKIFYLFRLLNSRGKTIVYVTHSNDLAKEAGRQVKILDGRIIAS